MKFTARSKQDIRVALINFGLLIVALVCANVFVQAKPKIEQNRFKRVAAGGMWMKVPVSWQEREVDVSRFQTVLLANQQLLQQIRLQNKQADAERKDAGQNKVHLEQSDLAEPVELAIDDGSQSLKEQSSKEKEQFSKEQSKQQPQQQLQLPTEAQIQNITLQANLIAAQKLSQSMVVSSASQAQQAAQQAQTAAANQPATQQQAVILDNVKKLTSPKMIWFQDAQRPSLSAVFSVMDQPGQLENTQDLEKLFAYCMQVQGIQSTWQPPKAFRLNRSGLHVVFSTTSIAFPGDRTRQLIAAVVFELDQKSQHVVVESTGQSVEQQANSSQQSSQSSNQTKAKREIWCVVLEDLLIGSPQDNLTQVMDNQAVIYELLESLEPLVGEPEANLAQLNQNQTLDGSVNQAGGGLANPAQPVQVPSLSE